MAERKNRKSEGGRLRRSEVMTMRFDPRTRYMMELASRVQRRTVSSFIDWAVTEALKGVDLGTRRVSVEGYIENIGDPPSYRDEPIKLTEEFRKLWDPNEADRLARLALNYPDLLNYDESILWKLIAGCPAVWHGPNDTLEKLDLRVLRKYWDTFKAVANGEADPSTLPRKDIDEEAENG